MCHYFQKLVLVILKLIVILVTYMYDTLSSSTSKYMCNHVCIKFLFWLCVQREKSNRPKKFKILIHEHMTYLKYEPIPRS